LTHGASRATSWLAGDYTATIQGFQESPSRFREKRFKGEIKGELRSTGSIRRCSSLAAHEKEMVQEESFGPPPPLLAGGAEEREELQAAAAPRRWYRGRRCRGKSKLEVWRL
jgi:hypothetical protein